MATAQAGNGVAASAVSVDEAAPKATTGRGPRWAVAEDTELCKAWIATSEDATVGANQKGATFKAKFLLNYSHLLKDYNKIMGTSHGLRTAGSCHSRFGRLSRLVLKYIAIEEQMGKPPSGDTDRDIYDTKCKDVFLQRHSDASNILDSVLVCKEVLRGHPKWRSFQSEEDSDAKKRAENKKARPQGTKKAKQLEADRKMIEKIVTAKEAAPKTSSRDELLKQIGSGFEAISDGEESLPSRPSYYQYTVSHQFFVLIFFALFLVLKMTAQGMTDGKIMDALTPVTKAKFAKRIAEERMAAMSCSSSKKPRTIQVDAGNCEASRLTTDNMALEVDGNAGDEEPNEASQDSSDFLERECDGEDPDENNARYLQEEEDNLEVQENLKRYLADGYNNTGSSGSRGTAI